MQMSSTASMCGGLYRVLARTRVRTAGVKIEFDSRPERNPQTVPVRQLRQAGRMDHHGTAALHHTIWRGARDACIIQHRGSGSGSRRWAVGSRRWCIKIASVPTTPGTTKRSSPATCTASHRHRLLYMQLALVLVLVQYAVIRWRGSRGSWTFLGVDDMQVGAHEAGLLFVDAKCITIEQGRMLPCQILESREPG